MNLLKYDARNQPEQHKIGSRADRIVNIVIGLNIVMVMVAIGFIAVAPGSGKGSLKTLAQERLAAFSSQVTSAKLRAMEGNLDTGSESASKGAAGVGLTGSAPELNLGGGGPVQPGGYEPPVIDQAGTCISGHIIDVYHQQIGAGWEIVVRADQPESVPVTLVADANGHFQINNLEKGTYNVELTIPEGYRPYTLASFPVTLNGETSSCAEVRFKMEALACLNVLKLDEGGTFDLRDRVGIPGWKVFATLGETTLQATTDGEGKAVFRNLIPGNWTISEESRAGWQPAAGQLPSRVVTLLSPLSAGQCQAETFINQQVHTSCIAVKKEETNGNPVAGWTVFLKHKAGTRPDQQAVTNTDGFAYFTNLPLGEWTVREEVRDLWKPASPTQQDVNLTQADGLCPQVTFVNEPLGCIDGYKINHLEEGLPGWMITATNDQTGEKFETKTDVDGYFIFNKLPLGTYTVSEVVQPGWKAVTPSSFQLDVTEPFTCKPARFKNITEFACLDVYKRDSYDNSGLPGWMVTIKPAYGGEEISSVTDGIGWTRFNQLVPGDWILSEVMQAGWDPDGVTSTMVSLEASGTCSVFTFYNHQEGRQIPTPGQGDGSNPCREYYTVKRGDTLFGIARLYNVTLQDIRKVNNIPNPNLIHPNMQICIPR